MSVPAPYVLIVEAEAVTADLLQRMVREVRTDAEVVAMTDGKAALVACEQRLPDLVIADGELPGLPGLELLRALRGQPRAVGLPFVLMSARLDAASVRAALPLAPSAYLARPLDPAKLRQRLHGLLGIATDSVAKRSLDDYLDSVRLQGQGAPLLGEVRIAVGQYLQASEKSLSELNDAFARDPQITAHLIAVANSAGQHRGAPCQTLMQALPHLGVTRALNLVLNLSLQRSASLRDERLAERAGKAWARAQQSAELAHWLAGELALDAEVCYTAGLLHNLGDLALLRSLQDWRNSGGGLRDAEIDRAMAQHASGFGSALRVQWRLPIGLRELVSAFYGLGQKAFSREALVLNLTGQLMNLPPDKAPLALLEARAARLLRLKADLLERLPADLFAS